MPNWVTNQVTAPKKVLDDLVQMEMVDNEPILADLVVGASTVPTEQHEELVVDFARVVPLPANYEQGGCSGQHEPGVVCWYRWNIDNWGTKWNACHEISYEPLEAGKDAPDDLYVLRYDTAWSAAFPVLGALSKKHPETPIQIDWADEDLGGNCGRILITDGEIDESMDPVKGNYDDASITFAIELRYQKSRADYELSNLVGELESAEKRQSGEYLEKYGDAEWAQPLDDEALRRSLEREMSKEWEHLHASLASVDLDQFPNVKPAFESAWANLREARDAGA